MKVFGLVGHPVSHSLSAKYFADKFLQLGLNYKYLLFDLKQIDDVRDLISANPALAGFNVTIPYKKEIIPFLDEMDPIALEIGSVNVVRIENSKLKGYNSDYYGFRSSLTTWQPQMEYTRALVLGTGGTSATVRKVLNDLDIPFIVVSRSKKEGAYTYEELRREDDLIMDSNLIINTTPVGMYPEINDWPDVNLDLIDNRHFVFDLIYNPEKTVLLAECEKRGASIKNGLEMLYLQAERSWEIWNTEN